MSLLCTDWGIPINNNTICYLCGDDKNTCGENPKNCMTQFKNERDKQIEDISLMGEMYKDIIKEIDKLLEQENVDPVKRIQFNAEATKAMMQKMMDEFNFPLDKPSNIV